MSNPLNQIGPWNKRANFSVDRHQQVVDTLNAVRQIVPPGDGSQTINGPFGQVVIPRRQRDGLTFGWFVLTGPASRYGTYTAHRLLSPASTFDTATVSTFSSSDIGTSGTDSVYLINAREEGKSTHDLDSGGTFLPMKFFGVFNQFAKDGKACYLIDGRQGEACT
jgi:hypothetical protein